MADLKGVKKRWLSEGDKYTGVYGQRKFRAAIEDIEKGLLSAKLGLKDLIDILGASDDFRLGIEDFLKMERVIVQQQEILDGILKHTGYKK